MNCNTSTKRVVAAPAFDHLVNSFFNSAIGDVIHSTGSKKHITRPATNVVALDDKYILEIGLPGLNKTDIAINIEDEVLTISDTREPKGENEKPNFRLREFNYAGFKKSYKLPDDIDTDSIVAAYHNGILEITLHKKEEALPQAPKKIQIQ